MSITGPSDKESGEVLEKVLPRPQSKESKALGRNISVKKGEKESREKKLFKKQLLVDTIIYAAQLDDKLHQRSEEGKVLVGPKETKPKELFFKTTMQKAKVSERKAKYEPEPIHKKSFAALTGVTRSELTRTQLVNAFERGLEHYLYVKVAPLADPRAAEKYSRQITAAVSPYVDNAIKEVAKMVAKGLPPEEAVQKVYDQARSSVRKVAKEGISNEEQRRVQNPLINEGNRGQIVRGMYECLGSEDAQSVLMRFFIYNARTPRA